MGKGREGTRVKDNMNWKGQWQMERARDKKKDKDEEQWIR